MPRIVVPSSVRNKAIQIASTIVGAGVFAEGAKIAKHHHDAVKSKLTAEGHSHQELQDHEQVPAGHTVLHKT